MSRYYIKVKESKNEIERVLSILFSKGYVFHHPERIKSIEDFRMTYGSFYQFGFNYWNYIAMGADIECKRVINVTTDMPGILITIEEYLKLNE